MQFNIDKSCKEIRLELVDGQTVLAHVYVNLINAVVVCKLTYFSFKLGQQFDVVNKVAISFRQLMNHTLGVIVRLATLKNFIYAEVAIFDKFAVFHIENVRKAEYFFVISLDYV